MTLVAVLLALTSLVAFVVYIFAAPTPLRIAVGPTGGDDMRLVVSIMQTFAREKHGIRLRLIPVDGVTSSAEALALEKADLAIVRSDGNIPPTAATIAIMHRDVATLIGRPYSGIQSLNDLVGKRVAIPRSFTLNQKLLNFVLERSGVDASRVIKLNVRPADIRSAAAENRIDAVFVVASPTSNFLASLTQDLSSEGGEFPRIVAIPDAEAIAQRNPLLETFTLLRGTFGGSPPRPAESVETLAVTYRLVADRKLKDSVVTELTKSLFEVRQAVAADTPIGTRIEQPNTENPGPLVIHPGALSYFEGEQKSFIEQYGEWIYLGVMGAGLLGSIGAALLGRASGSKRPSGHSDLDRMLMVLRRTRTAESTATLDELQREADDSFARMVERAADSEIEEPMMSAFTIALGEVRNAIEDRRRVLSVDQLSGLAE